MRVELLIVDIDLLAIIPRVVREQLEKVDQVGVPELRGGGLQSVEKGRVLGSRPDRLPRGREGGLFGELFGRF